MTRKTHMTKREALREFKAGYQGSRDKASMRTAWNDYTDYLYKDGRISARQYDTWVVEEFQ